MPVKPLETKMPDGDMVARFTNDLGEALKGISGWTILEVAPCSNIITLEFDRDTTSNSPDYIKAQQIFGNLVRQYTPPKQLAMISLQDLSSELATQVELAFHNALEACNAAGQFVMNHMASAISIEQIAESSASNRFLQILRAKLEQLGVVDRMYTTAAEIGRA